MSLFNNICKADLPDIEFERLQLDSRKVDTQTVFIALLGARLDGRQYIHQAIKQGAVAVLAEADTDNPHGRVKTFNAVQIIYIAHLSSLQNALATACMSSMISDFPLIAITGTNGKTSIADMTYQCLLFLNKQPAYLGTLGVKTPNDEKELANTTPVAIELYNLLADIKLAGSDICALEVSSHALVEQRVHGLAFFVSAFSNLSHDHLDFHGDMSSYYQAKKALFTQYDANAFVINIDNKWGSLLVEELMNEASVENAKIIQVGRSAALTQQPNFVQACDIKVLPHGFKFALKTTTETVKCQLNLLGQFNIENALVVAGILLAQGFTLTEVMQAIESINAIKGRMETFYCPDKPLLVVDFAHTPDGLAQALQACRQHLSSTDCALYVVFGCGGDRDIDKRPLMGQVAAQYADRIIITNDNARSEDPMMIANAIYDGISNNTAVEIVLDRKAAIAQAYQQAQPGDVVLIAGKGHELTQEIGSEKIKYNERAYVQQLMERAA